MPSKYLVNTKNIEPEMEIHNPDPALSKDPWHSFEKHG